MPFEAAKNKFHASAPVTALTDSTGGAASGTLAAGITDTVAKNAIASLAAQVELLRAALAAHGIIQ